MAHITAIKQDVGIGREVSRPGLQLRAVRGHAGGIHGVAAQREAARRAMADDLHRFNALQPGQCLAHSVQAGFAAVHHAQHGVGGKAGQQAGLVGHAGVHDEHRCDNAICAHAGDACILGAGAGQGDGGCGGGSFFCFHFLG